VFVSQQEEAIAVLPDREAFSILSIQVVQGPDLGCLWHEWEVLWERPVADVHEYAGQRQWQEIREQAAVVDDGAPWLADAAGYGEVARRRLEAAEDFGEQVVR
jgi:hypothetical protein